MESIGQGVSSSCPVCNSDRSFHWLDLPDRFQVEKGLEWKLNRCKNCGTSFIENKPTASLLAYFYPTTGYDPFVSAENKKTPIQSFYAFIRKFSLILRFRLLGLPQHTNSPLLDVGCGTGEFLLHAKDRGWNPYGIDLSDIASETNRKCNINFSQLDINQLENFVTDTQFEAITFWHSLEHTYEPKKILDVTNQLLSERGKLVIAVPNATSWDARIYRENWVAYDAPRHLVMFTPDSLTYLLETSGFRVKKITSLSLDLLYNIYFSEQLLKSRKSKTDWYFPIRLLSAFVPSLVGGIAGASVLAVVAEKAKK